MMGGARQRRPKIGPSGNALRAGAGPPVPQWAPPLVLASVPLTERQQIVVVPDNAISGEQEHEPVQMRSGNLTDRVKGWLPGQGAWRSRDWRLIRGCSRSAIFAMTAF